MVATAVSVTGGLLGCGPTAGPAAAARTGAALRTAVTDRLGIEVPILQAPMSRIVTPAMVAAVSNAGGLGIFPGIGVQPEDLAAAIAEIRRRTARPFGVNLILHRDLMRPVSPESVPDTTQVAVAQALDGVRDRLGLGAGGQELHAFPDVIGPAIEVLLEARVPVFSVGLGNPGRELVGRCHERGMSVLAMASTVEDAVLLSEAGVDVIAAQGSDAGGHRSTWEKRTPERAAIGTFSLVPQVVDAVAQPVVAAGGVSDGRGLVAALALGAGGVLMGTRFIATTESDAPAFYKQAIVERSSDETVLTDAFTGLHARVLRNAFTERYATAAAPVLPPGMQQNAVADIVRVSAERGSGEFYPLYAGQGLGLVHDAPDSSDIVRGVVAEAESRLRALAPA